MLEQANNTAADSNPDLESHRDFLNRYYKWVRPVYDITRKYYLLGRDRVLDDLGGEDWQSLVEIGPGTGRNLRKLLQRKPDATVGGVEPCDEMLDHARQRLPRARLIHGFAETTDYRELLGRPIDRVLFSYSLSMIGEKDGALDAAIDALAPGGEVVVVDFADLTGLPGLAGRGLRRWLEAFHVTPLDPSPILERGGTVTYGPARYYLIGRIRKPLVD